MYSPNTKGQQRKRHVNSQRVNQLQQEIDEMERELRRRDIAIAYPKVQQESVPMLGHTKGNESWKCCEPDREHEEQQKEDQAAANKNLG